MRIIKSKNLLAQRLKVEDWSGILPQVAGIIKKVRTKGDTVLRQLTQRFDNVKLKGLEVTRAERNQAYRLVSRELIGSLDKISRRLKAFATKQLKQVREFRYRTKEGVVGQRVIPIDKVGVYIPGGRYPLPSSALMGIVPAVVAGVKEIIVCNPKPQAATIVAANMAGARRIFKVGGAQAIAAMAYGTRTVPRVDKIVGPGNRYVTAAKYLVSKDCGIDMLAGPSEIVIIADNSARPEWIAADMIAQAEHDIDAGVYCLTTSRKLADAVLKELESQIRQQPNKKTIVAALKKGFIVLAGSLDECVKLANLKAPEHLALHLVKPYQLIKKLKNYGSLFLGGASAVAFGDYVTGSNHILPTDGSARYSAGLSVFDFIKCVTYQSVTSSGLKTYTNVISPLARAEGLYGHLQSMVIRSHTE